ncbi:chitinase [Mangrovactinospora gilvigrisea]|uniref:chitinase n=1 Tax=Mangrovactinospora gilvigrisea TaxID=1428644 RepID=A0A1J7CE06_9ACTN|nr:glycosyl hydrolase family 18 protein [Mangrovactinospora gilvigrisea]OIV37906.1 chitinase [Mangrovactinospora gilvigrisea]
MRRPLRRLRAAVTALATAGAGTLLALGGAAAPAHAAAKPLPAHVFAPYFETYAGDDMATTAAASGNKYLTLAFLQTAGKGSCTPYWDGDTSQPVAASTYGSDIAELQANGGDAIPSFGGYTADDTGTDIADSCTDVASIAAAYENVVTTYNVSRIDLDIEDNSLTDSAGITRRNQAVKQVEDWAAANGRTVQFSYTLPSTTSGLAASGLNVLKNAVANGARVDVVNIMTFDYYDGATHEMATDSENAAQGLNGQLAKLYPSKTSAQLWAMTGVTEMPGIDDYGAAETTTTADAPTLYNWAVSKGISTLAMWALERDNGGCPGTAGSDSCSGISQSTWYFSQTWEPFTGGTSTPGNDFSVAVSPSSGSVAAGSSTTAAVSTAVTSGQAETVALTASGAPSGMTASVSPSSVTAGAGATLTVVASAATASGNYPITVVGTGPSGSRSATFTVTVTGGGTGGGTLQNAGFESGSLSPWTCQQGGSVVAAPVHSGSHALQVAATSAQTGECDQTVNLTPGSAHTLTAWVQGPYAYVGVKGGATASTWASGTGWTKLTVPFTVGSSGAVTVYAHGWYGQGNVYADGFSLS